MSDWGGAAATAAAAATPTPVVGGGSDWGGAAAKPKPTPAPKAPATMRHLTTPFTDPNRKPVFDTSKQDASIVNQGVDAANTVGGTLGLFNRPLKAVKAGLNEGLSYHHVDPGAGLSAMGRALAGTPNPGEEESNDAKMSRTISTILRALHLPDNAVTHGLYETAMDPSNLVSLPISKGRTAMGVLTDAAEGHGFNAAVNAGQKIAANPVGKKVTDAIAQAHDLLGVHSAAKRELARLHGAQWLDKYAEYRAQLMRYGGQSPEESLRSELQKHLNEMSPDQRAAYERALVRGGEGLPFASQISPKGKTVAPPSTATGDPSQIGLGLKAATKPAPRPAPAARPKPIVDVVSPPQHGPATIPDTRISPSKGARFSPQVGFGKPKMTPAQAKAYYDQIAKRKSAQAKFVTNPHRPDNTTLGLGEGGEQRSLFGTQPFTVPPTTTRPTLGYTPQRVDQSISDVAKRLGGLNDEDRKIYDLMRDRHTPTGLKHSILDYASLPSDIITGGMFVQPVGHMANITGLGSMTDLSAVAKALGTGTKDNVKKLGALPNRVSGGRIPVIGPGPETEEAIAARHAGAQRGGAISTHKTERNNPLDAGLSATTGGLSKIPKVGQALALVPKAVRGLYRASGDILWKFDDEVKANRWQNLVDSGMDPNRAGLRVGGELVDYENKSPAARALRPIAPFSTWRTKAPLAVARNAVENPGRVAALNRAVPAAMGGAQGQDADTGKPYISSLAGAEFNRGTSSLPGAAKYVTGSIGTIPALTLDAAGALYGAGIPDTKRGQQEKKRLRTFATYGQEPGTFLLNELPGLSQILQYGPGGMFNRGQAPSTINDLLSLIRVRPGNP